MNINQIEDPKTRAFAQACYEQKTIPELKIALSRSLTIYDLRRWGATVIEDQAREAIKAALDEKVDHFNRVFSDK